MFTEAKQAYFNPGHTFLEEPINFKLKLLLLVFCQFAASFVIIPWILKTFMSI